MATAASVMPGEVLDSTVRIYCPAHNLGFIAARTKHVRCESNGHELDQNFPYSSFWEYCCDCQHYWPMDPSRTTAEAECPVCDRQLARRYVCQECKVVSVESERGAPRKVYSISVSHGPSPACPGCLNNPSTSLVEHDCPEFKTTFLTSHSTCPFCEKVLELPPSFPCSVEKYLQKVHSPTTKLKFNAEKNTLEESKSGDYVLLEKVPGSPVPIVLPGVTRLASKQDYYNSYYELFNCENPVPGEVIVLSPALVERSQDNWILKEAGFIEVKPESLPISSPDVSPQRMACSFCAAEIQADHTFCKRCGAAQSQNTPSTAQPPQPVQVAAAQTPSATNVLPASTPFSISNTADLVEPSVVPVASGLPVKGLIIALIGFVCVVGLVALVSISGGKSSVERKLDDAIVKGNLIGQNSESARTLYAQLQSNGTSAQKLKAYQEKLTPLLTSHGEQLTRNLMEIGYNEPDAAEWLDAGNKLDWAAELNPGNQRIASRAAYCDGRAAYLQKQLDVAQNAWARASSSDKNWVLPVNGLGMVALARKDYPTARAYFSQAQRVDPKWPFPYENIGNTYWQEKDFDNARTSYRQALELAPNWSKPHWHLGEVAINDGDYATAVSEFEAALAPNAIGLKNNEPAQVQKRLNWARQRAGIY